MTLNQPNAKDSSVLSDADAIDKVGLAPLGRMRSNTERLADWGGVLLTAYAAFTLVSHAAVKPFWADEIVTVGLARLPSLGAVRTALENSADSHPPSFYVMERLAARLPVNELIAFRIPSILAFCCLILCVFLFIRKVRGSVCALACATIPLLSVLFYPYAVEARGYSLMAGLGALAMVSYQRAHKTKWCVLLGGSLVAATASHYYAVFAAFPLILAELALLVKERRLRLGVWVALFLSVMPVVVFWRLLQILKSTYGSHFIMQLSPLEVARSYGFLWNLPPSPAVGLAATAFAAILFLGLFRPKGALPNFANDIALQDHVLALGFIILPVVMGLAFKVLHGGFLPRYMILAVLGFPLAASYVLSFLDLRLVGLFSILFFASLGAQEAGFWHRELHSFGSKVDPSEGAERLLKSAGYDNLPVVVSGPNNYLQLAYYASPETHSRMFFAADPPTAIIYVGSDDADKLLLSLRPYLAVQVDELANFVGIHREFLIYSDTSNDWDWLPIQMLHDGYTLDVVAIDHEKRVYFVHRKRS